MTELNFFQRGALNRLGDVICPRNEDFPSFSELDCVHHVGIVLDELPESDRADLLLLLTVMWFMPAFFMRIFLILIEKFSDLNGPLGALIRMLGFGLRGVVFALYYSGLTGPKSIARKTPVEVVGYSVNVALD